MRSSEGFECYPHCALTPSGPIFMLPRFINSTEAKKIFSPDASPFHLLNVMILIIFIRCRALSRGVHGSWDTATHGTRLQKALFCLTSLAQEQDRKHRLLTFASAPLLLSPTSRTFNPNTPGDRQACTQQVFIQHL